MSEPQYLKQPIILLKEGVDTTQGESQIISNINACQSIVDILRTTLGPRGMDKLIHTNNKLVTITNDGATIIELLNVVHPAVRILIDISKAQDAEVGDGTTSVVLIAGELLAEAKLFLEEGVAPQVIIKGYQKACQEAVRILNEMQIDLSDKNETERRNILKHCARTALSSKLVATHQEIFSSMVVDTVLTLNTTKSFDKTMIGIKKVLGGSVADSRLIHGVAFKKTFSYAGFEQQPKKFTQPKVLLLNVELELKAEKENAEIRVTNPQEYQSIVDAEWKIIFNKLDLILATGAQIVLSRLPIGDLATQYFADHGVFCAGRVDETDLRRTALATNGQIQSVVTNIQQDVLGTCGQFEEVQIGSERYNLFTDCPKAQNATLILRGGAQQFIDETERSLNDAIMVVHRAFCTTHIVSGGGAVEMELSSRLRYLSRTVHGKQQLVINAFAKALECIPRALAKNSGLDQVDVLNKLRKAHHQTKNIQQWIGINAIQGDICSTYDDFIWEPALVKLNAIQAATEAVCLILSVDETIKNPKSNPEPQHTSTAKTNPYRMNQRGGRM